MPRARCLENTKSPSIRLNTEPEVLPAWKRPRVETPPKGRRSAWCPRNTPTLRQLRSRWRYPRAASRISNSLSSIESYKRSQGARVAIARSVVSGVGAEPRDEFTALPPPRRSRPAPNELDFPLQSKWTASLCGCRAARATDGSKLIEPQFDDVRLANVRFDVTE